LPQKEIAEAYKKQLNESGIFPAPIVTEIEPLTEFYVAEDYHHNYYNDNASQPYCQFVVRPKVEKLKKSFSEKLK
jgi:peptide-methionine (S)-S-oxide reductase